MHAREPLALLGNEIADAPRFEGVVPLRAPLRCDALGDRARDLVLVVRVTDQLQKFRRRQTDFRKQLTAQARHETILARIAAAQRRARFVDRARQEHQACEPRTRIARRSPAQADRAHVLDGSGKL